MVFFLDCDADIVYGRKKELSRDEIERQLSEYRQLAAAFHKRFVLLNAWQSPELCCQQAVNQIVERSFSQIGNK
jgi:thymidylate kinase